jgi:acetyl-CoA carboxylase biotin carboxyl carrier protein
METGEIKKIIDLIKNTDIDELRWESGDLKISLKRSEFDSQDKNEKIKVSPKPAASDVNNKKGLSIKSPMVGTFYRAQSSDYPPLVMEGNHVTPGQKVAVIEAMKIIKDVVSSVKGKIVKVLVEDGQPVEYGQELFLIEAGK